MSGVDLARRIAQLELSGRCLRDLFVGASDEELRWRPAAGKWSQLEVLGHLLDEERMDFRQRLSLVLEDPTKPWPPIDPEGWARDKDYQGQDPAETLASFAAEREASLAWLAGLEGADWDRTHEHPLLGPIRAGDLLVSWVTHDRLHLRQIAGLLAERVGAHAAPYSSRYAAP